MQCLIDLVVFVLGSDIVPFGVVLNQVCLEQLPEGFAVLFLYPESFVLLFLCELVEVGLEGIFPFVLFE